MVTVGITGGIGSGKTTVCDLWQSLGARILDADDLAKEIMNGNAQVRSKIKKAFGERSYREDGSLNRTHLADEAFAKGRVEELNAIVHPHIPEYSRRIIEDARENGYKVFVYEATLLLRKQRPDFLDYVVLVLSDQEKRVKRVQKRKGMTEKKVLERIDKQQDFKSLTHLADFVIENNGTLKELRQKAESLFQKFTGEERPATDMGNFEC